VLLVIDVCNAGSIRGSLLFELGHVEKGGVILLASTIPSQNSMESADDPALGPHGLLTASLLNALEFDYVNDGQITLKELRHHLPGQMEYTLSTRRKLPGLNVPEQNFFMASSLSIPDTLGLVSAREKNLPNPESYYCTWFDEKDFKKMEKFEHRLAGRWSLTRALSPRGTLTDLDTGKIVSPEPLLGSDGKPLLEEFEVVLNATAIRDYDADKFQLQPVEQGEFAILYRSPAGEQRGTGQYRYGRYGLNNLVLASESSEDNVIVSQLDADHLTLTMKRTWHYLAPWKQGEKSEARAVASETFVYELTRNR